MPYDARCHWIYDRYKWHPSIVHEMSIDEVNKHYNIIMTVTKEEVKANNELISGLVKHANKLFKTYFGR